MSGVHLVCLMWREGPDPHAGGRSSEMVLSFRLPFSGTREKAKGSGVSLSGLVQLPPVEGNEVELPEDESEESEKVEHADAGRLMLSPGLTSSRGVLSRSPFCVASKVVKIWARGVLGGET